MNVYLIVFVLSVIFIVTVSLTTKGKDESLFYRDHCTEDKDCENEQRGGVSGSKCEYDNDYDKNICIHPGEQVCRITNTWMDGDALLPDVVADKTIGEIIRCDPSKNDCTSCINQPQWGCLTKDTEVDGRRLVQQFFVSGVVQPVYYYKIRVLDDKGQTIQPGGPCPRVDNKHTCDEEVKDKDGNPVPGFCFADKNGLCNMVIPLSDDSMTGVCAPIVGNADTGTGTCNPQTSDIFLASAGTAQSEWICACRNPRMFDHISTQNNDSNVTGVTDCVYEKACGFNHEDPDKSLGFLYVVDHDNEKNVVACKTNDECSGSNNPSATGENGGKCCIHDTTGEGYEGTTCLRNGETLKAGDPLDDNYVCHKRWDSTNTESEWWNSDGKCDCKPGYRYSWPVTSTTINSDGNEVIINDPDNSEKLCVLDSCVDRDINGYVISAAKDSNGTFDYSYRAPYLRNSSASDYQCKCSQDSLHRLDAGQAIKRSGRDATDVNMPYRANSMLNDLKGRILVQPACITDPCGHGGTFNPPDNAGTTNRKFCGIGETPTGFSGDVGWCDGPIGDDEKQVPKLSLDMYFPNWINQTCLNRCTEASCGSGELTRGTCVPSSSYSTGGIDCVDCKCPYTNACETLTKDECETKDAPTIQAFKKKFGSQTAEGVMPCAWNDNEKKCRRTAEEASQVGGLQNTCSFRINGVISSGDICQGSNPTKGPKYGEQSTGLCCDRNNQLIDCNIHEITTTLTVEAKVDDDPSKSIYHEDIYICDSPTS